MKILFIINDAPGSERTYNALRMAVALQKEQPPVDVLIFLMGDAVTCALPNQFTPQGYYNIERMLKAIIPKEGHVKTCDTSASARGIKELTFIEGIENSAMSQLTQWTIEADKVLTC